MTNVGERVGYSAHFLHSVAADYNVSKRRGEVLSIEGSFALIRWDDEPERPHRAHLSNIAAVDSIAFSDPHARTTK